MLRNVLAVFISCFILLSCSNKEDAELNYADAVASYSKQDLDSAMRLIDLAIKKDSSFYQAKLLKAKIFFFKNSLEEANSILHKLVEKYPQYTEARIWYARTLIAQQLYGEAEKFLIKELSFNPGDCRVFYLYGNLYKKLNRLDESLSMYRKAENLLKENSKIYLELADIWLVLGMTDYALDELDKARILSGGF